MKRDWTSLLVFPSVLVLLGACSFAPYTLDTTVIGTIEEIDIEEKFFIDDAFLVIRADNHQAGRNLYTIPVGNSNSYEVGQRVELDIYSNTDADIWDLNNLKFEIDVLDE